MVEVVYYNAPLKSCGQNLGTFLGRSMGFGYLEPNREAFPPKGPAS